MNQLDIQERIIRIEKLKELPTLQEIESISRGMNLKIIFEGEIQSQRVKIGEEWKHQLPKYSIGIHTIEEEINIVKLISDEEIELNQEFFENCAKEYGILGTKLINQFVEKYRVKPYDGFPLKTLNPYGDTDYKQIGLMGEWKYCFHGFHCAFTHKKTGQHIEVPLTYGEEFGELDPYFFVDFIQTTPKFQPLPIKIYENYADGKRILEVMLRIGKFEEIESNLKGRKGIVVRDRKKKQVKVFKEGLNEVLKRK